MCSTSNVNEALKGFSSGTPSVIPSVSAHRVRQNRSRYFLLDVREDPEIEEKAVSEVDAKMPLGAICHDASSLLAQVPDGKKIVTLCNTGERAKLAAGSIAAQKAGIEVAVLQRGIVGWENVSALSPDLLVVLGLGDSTEKLSLSLAAAAAAVDSHQTVVLVLMSDGVNWFLRPDSAKVAEAKTANVESVEQGAPFKPCKAMLKKFLTNCGVIVACTTCIKHRGYSFESDMMECVNPMQMPDLVRMMGEAKGGCLQFM